jgi:cell division protein FtsB
MRDGFDHHARQPESSCATISIIMRNGFNRQVDYAVFVFLSSTLYIARLGLQNVWSFSGRLNRGGVCAKMILYSSARGRYDLRMAKGVHMARQNTKRQTTEKTNAGGYSRVIDIEEAQRIRREKRAAAAKGRKKAVPAPKPVPEPIVAESAVEPVRTGNGALGRVICLLLAVAMLVLIVISGIRILDLKAEAEEAKRALAISMEEKADLEQELAMLHDPAYIEAQARERLRMIKDGETLYIFEDPQEDTTQ